jgi:hypothetical protein
LPRLRVKHFSREYASDYGGLSNFEVARAFLRERGFARSAWRLLRELRVSLCLKQADRER